MATVVTAVPATVETAMPTPDERLRAATAEIRSAMNDLGIPSYMVMVREESSGVAKMMDFKRDGELHHIRELA